MSTLTTLPTAPAPTGPHPVAFTPCEEVALDRVIESLRMGAISNVVMRHLEVDGVLQLEPLLDLSGAAPCGN